MDSVEIGTQVLQTGACRHPRLDEPVEAQLQRGAGGHVEDCFHRGAVVIRTFSFGNGFFCRNRWGEVTRLAETEVVPRTKTAR